MLLILLSCSVDERRLSLARSSEAGQASEQVSPAGAGASDEGQGGSAGVDTEATEAGAAGELPRCGNGIIESAEECDDGGDAEYDGCNVACELEPGYECSGEPSSCRRCTGEPGMRRCAIAGGSFVLGSDDERVPAAVSAFQLDELEVTVARFRAFTTTFSGPPEPGAGAHPEVPDSGWRSAWNTLLPATKQELLGSLHCHASWSTWSDEPARREQFPMTCVSYYVAFAFCIAQSGRLPTEAEWEYAAAGGSQQRAYPWGSAEPSPERALFGSNALASAGGLAAGRGRFGQLDLSGSVWEWSLDFFAPYPGDCDRCAEVDNGFERVLRGGSFVGDAEFLRSSFRFGSDPSPALGNVGFRCAYAPDA